MAIAGAYSAHPLMHAESTWAPWPCDVATLGGGGAVSMEAGAAVAVRDKEDSHSSLSEWSEGNHRRSPHRQQAGDSPDLFWG